MYLAETRSEAIKAFDEFLVLYDAKYPKGCGSRTATLTMVYKLAEQAERHWRRLNAHTLILALIQGGKFEDGVLKKAA